ncbi:hypothetical protein GY45DRAFT_1374073 [Cubamyces sp. BRFM 1775]|nr:hypothetical protein GY45DRAFT_1374073 [Cubamyces sp. BRFM 1775]
MPGAAVGTSHCPPPGGRPFDAYRSAARLREAYSAAQTPQPYLELARGKPSTNIRAALHQTAPQAARRETAQMRAIPTSPNNDVRPAIASRFAVITGTADGSPQSRKGSASDEAAEAQDVTAIG